MTRAGRKRAVKSALTLMWCGVSFVYLFPYTWMVLTGIRRPVDSLTMPPRLIFTPSLDGFRTIFGQVHFQGYLLNSIVVSVLSEVVPVV